MKLKSIRVANFKCVEDSDECPVDRVTCLIGKNEAGKSTILEALEKLHPVPGTSDEFDEEEFPRRHLATYRQRKEREAANVLTTRWILDDDDVHAVEELLGKGALLEPEVIIGKGY